MNSVTRRFAVLALTSSMVVVLSVGYSASVGLGSAFGYETTQESEKNGKGKDKVKKKGKSFRAYKQTRKYDFKIEREGGPPFQSVKSASCKYRPPGHVEGTPLIDWPWTGFEIQNDGTAVMFFRANFLPVTTAPDDQIIEGIAPLPDGQMPADDGPQNRAAPGQIPVVGPISTGSLIITVVEETETEEITTTVAIEDVMPTEIDPCD